MILSCISFLFISLPQPIYLLVINMVLLGAGFGLISTPTVVSIQYVVGWEERGVVTGINQFGRYLGQSLGAAIFGAIFNFNYGKEMDQADVTISKDMEDVIYQLQIHGIA